MVQTIIRKIPEYWFKYLVLTYMKGSYRATKKFTSKEAAFNFAEKMFMEKGLHSNIFEIENVWET